jgi:hypothetical protein
LIDRCGKVGFDRYSIDQDVFRSAAEQAASGQGALTATAVDTQADHHQVMLLGRFRREEEKEKATVTAGALHNCHEPERQQLAVPNRGKISVKFVE